MMVIQKSDDEPHLYELHYLGFVALDFKGVDAAKSSAPDFARKVLNQLSAMIAD